MINETGTDLPPGCGATPGLRGVALEDWKQELLCETVLGEKRPGVAFQRVREKLERDGEIAIGTGNGIEFVWIPLPYAG
jgi:hypothetical protein